MAWRRISALLFTVGWGANHFAPLLPVYRRELQLDAAAPALLFGVYALGLMPGLLLAGPLSDRLGRRALVRPAAVGALLVSAGLGLLARDYVALLVGRFAYGAMAGAAMSPGAVWLAESSQSTGTGVAARRATIALSGGFGVGPLISGALAQWLPAPTLTPYLVHVTALAVALAWSWHTPETRARTHLPGPLVRLGLPPPARRRFLVGVLPMAPFVFGFPTIAFAGLPALLPLSSLGAPLAMTGALSALTLLTGVAAQPLTRRLTAAATARLGLSLGAVGLLVGAGALQAQAPWWLLLASPLLGAGYGLGMTAGLRQVEALAPADLRGGVTGLFYVLTYLGFAAPWLLALAARVVPGPLVLAAAAAHALVTVAWLTAVDASGRA